MLIHKRTQLTSQRCIRTILTSSCIVLRSAFDRFQEQAYQWKDIDDVSNTETPYQLWSAHYAAISSCNEAIAFINSVSNQDEYQEQLGEALLCRAFSMFQLSTVFCQAYDKTTAAKELGLPYPTEPEKVVGRLIERGTLAELYQKIEADMLKGISLVGTKYAKPKFHFTKQAAYAFATRSISMHSSMTRR